MAQENMNKKKYVVFEMVKILKEHTDRQHPMKQRELVEKLHEAGYETDRSTVRRTMTDLVLDESSRVRSLANTAHDEKDSSYETYYSGLYYDQEFTDAELRWLIDGILYSRNVPHEARKKLLEKLCGLGNKYFRKNLNLNKIRRLAADEPVNPELFENIDRIGRAIDSGRKITLMYKYMGAGVREYWIIDLEKEKVTTYIEGEPMMAYVYSFQDEIPVYIYDGKLKITVGSADNI